MVEVQVQDLVLLLELAVQGLALEMAQLESELRGLVAPQGLYLVGKE